MYPTFELGSWHVSTYGALYALAVLVFGLGAFRRLLRLGSPAGALAQDLLLVIAGMVAGTYLPCVGPTIQRLVQAGRLALIGHPSVLWGLAAGVGLAAWRCRRRRLPVGRTLDLGILPLPLALAFVRLGCQAAEPITCPVGLNDGSWGLRFHSLLDLSHMPDNCAGCMLPYYLCYEGQELPIIGGLRRQALSRMARALGGQAGVTGYQGWGITCGGPYLFALTEPGGGSNWSFFGGDYAVITPTQVISFPVGFWIPGARPLTLTLAYTMPVNVSWGLYAGDRKAPNLGRPLTQPLSLSGFTYVWLVSSPVPSGTAPGPYTQIVTATTDPPANPRSQSVSHLVWIGGWVAPPPPPAWHRRYLPLLLQR